MDTCAFRWVYVEYIQDALFWHIIGSFLPGKYEWLEAKNGCLEDDLPFQLCHFLGSSR